MADRLRLITSNLGVGNASSSLSSLYSITPALDTLKITHDNGTAFTLDVPGNIRTEAIHAAQVNIDVGIANTMEMQSMTLSGPLVSNGASLSGNIVLGSSGLFRTEPGNVILGNSAYINTNSPTFHTTSLASNVDITTPLLTANTVIANGVNVIDTIKNIQSSSKRYYVKTTGSDTNDGRSWDKAFKTIKQAANVATSYSTIYVETGDYFENNPIWLNPRVSVIGDNLRTTRLFALNPKVHYFFVDDLCYIYGFRFIDLKRPAFCVTFPCCICEAEVQFGRISAINVLYSPTGYASAPPVTIESPDSFTGIAPTATATVTAKTEVASISLTTAGDSYPGITPTVTLSVPQSATGVQPQATAQLLSNAVSTVTITEVGTKYLSTPNVTISAPASGTQATAVATLNASGYISTINVTSGGSGYVNAPTVSIDPPPAIQATATVTMSFQATIGTVTGFTIVEKGAGYTSPPQVTISAPASIKAEAVAVVSGGLVTGITVTNPGSGYLQSMAKPHISIPPPALKKCFITGSPYVQNCSSITGPFNRSGNKITQLPPYDLDVFDVDDTGAGGGMLIDGAVANVFSPLRSMVADSFTQVNQGGPGHCVLNTGYAQFVSCFTTFCTYSFRSVDGGTTNISTSVTDFGTYGLVSTGYWDTPIAAGTISQRYRSSVASVTIAEGQGGSGYTTPPTVVFSGGNPYGGVHATANAVLLADRVDSVVVDVNNAGQYETTPIVTFVGGGANVVANGTVYMSSVNPIRVQDMQFGFASGRQPNQGDVTKYNGVWYTVTGVAFIEDGVYDVSMYPAVFSADGGDPLEFFQGSTVGTGQHVMEYAGAGVTYNALLEFGGQPNEGNQVVDVYPGRIFYCLTDHLGNQTIGKYFAVEQLTGAVTLNTDKFSLSGLEAIGPFKRNGNPAGVRLEEVSNDVNLQNSLGTVGATTVPTQFAVKSYVDRRTLRQGGSTGSAYVKNSADDYDASWIPVVLESEKAQPLGVANIDAQGRIVGDGSVVSNINASNIVLGTLDTSRIGTGTPTGVGDLVLSEGPAFLTNITINGPAPTVTLRDINHQSAFVSCDANVVTIQGGAINGNTPAQVNSQWPLTINLSNNDCTIGGNVFAAGDIVAYASDIRLKHNIRPISDTPVEDIAKLRGVRFEWNDQTHQPMRGTDIGLIAQDVQDVLPEAVRAAPFDAEYLTVDTGNKVTALLIEAVKELSLRLERIEASLIRNQTIRNS